ncbi:MAG: SHOCT domain-containing protein [Flavobacteriales bacterium]|nr:SHOCT domain-containing protein [Flavobacteriales bacterium]
MRFVNLLTIILAFHVVGSCLAQNATDTILAKDNVMFPLPTVNINVGFNHAFTDVKLNNGPSPFRQLGYQLTVIQQVNKFLNAGFELYTGSIYGEEQRDLVNLNYRTSLVSPRLNIEYNFYPLLKPDANGRQLIRPYVGFGVGMVFFRSKGDLKDANGNTYHYWTNGQIYAEEEGTVDITEATQLERDFEYETDLRDANLDGFRKYSQMAFTLPVNAGVRFQISKNVGVNAAFAYVLNTTDLIDNVNKDSDGVRQGTAGFDNSLYGSVGLSVFLGRTKPSAEPVKRFDDLMASDEKESEEVSAVETESSDSKSVTIESIPDKKVAKDPLATMSEQLVNASNSFKDLSEKSGQLVEQANTQLAEIAERKIESNKDLRDAKQASISILENSISELTETNTQLSETASRLNLAYSDLSTERITTGISNTEKIETTVKAAIPAVESLKEKVKSAKTPEELRSIMNIASKNLSHTNEIFTEESKQMNEAILEARKSVVERRTQLILMSAKNLSNISQTAISETELQQVDIERELTELLDEGTISQQEFEQLKSTLTESLATAKANAQPESGPEKNVELNAEQSELATAANQLISVSKILSESNEAAEKTLSANSEQLSLIAGKDLKSKDDLRAAKEEALRILESSVAVLNESNTKINEVTTDLSSAAGSLSDNKIGAEVVSTGKISLAISSASNVVESSKSQIKASKNEDELKSILKLASTSLDRTVEVFGSESSVINESIIEARKAVIEAKAKDLAANPIIADDLESVEQSSIELQKFEEELAALKEAGAIDTEEFSKISEVLNASEENLKSLETVAQTISTDSKLKSVNSVSTRVSESVATSTAKTESELSEQTKSLESLKTELAEATTKKSIEATKSALESILDQTEATLIQTQKVAKIQLAELKKAQVPTKEIELPALAQKIEVLEGIVKSNAESLNRLGEVSGLVQNSKKQEELIQASSDLNKVLDESSASESLVSTSFSSNDNQIKAQIIENRIENLQKARQNVQVAPNKGIQKLEADLTSEVINLANQNIISQSQKQELIERISPISSEELATSKSLKGSNSDATQTAEGINAAISGQKEQSAKPSTAGSSEPDKTKPKTRDLSRESIQDTKPKETGGYHWADLNKNNWISPDEVLHFIDLLFEGEADRSVEDIQNLIDYYFDQE